MALAASTPYETALGHMERLLEALADRVPPPQRVAYCDGFVFRYREKTVHQALVQKLARLITGLRSSNLLLFHGMLQEHGAIQRMLDEFNEDIMFLSFAAIDGELTEIHQRYLDNFYTEEFDIPDDPLKSTQKRGMVPRQKIRAYISNRPEFGSDRSTGVANLRTVEKAYSGYIHGASPHIMEMFGGEPAHFHTSGMLGTPLFYDHVYDTWNYYYRSLVSFCMATKAFGLEELAVAAVAMLDDFERSSPERAPNMPNNS